MVILGYIMVVLGCTMVVFGFKIWVQSSHGTSFPYAFFSPFPYLFPSSSLFFFLSYYISKCFFFFPSLFSSFNVVILNFYRMSREVQEETRYI